MKKVLWISRHEMTTAQLSDLERIMGGKVELLCWKENVRNVTELMPLIEQADAIAAVLPLQMQSNLLKVAEGKPVLQAMAERVLSETERTLEDGRKEREVHARRHPRRQQGDAAPAGKRGLYPLRHHPCGGRHPAHRLPAVVPDPEPAGVSGKTV